MGEAIDQGMPTQPQPAEGPGADNRGEQVIDVAELEQVEGPILEGLGRILSPDRVIGRTQLTSPVGEAYTEGPGLRAEWDFSFPDAPANARGTLIIEGSDEGQGRAVLKGCVDVTRLAGIQPTTCAEVVYNPDGDEISGSWYAFADVLGANAFVGIADGGYSFYELGDSFQVPGMEGVSVSGTVGGGLGQPSIDYLRIVGTVARRNGIELSGTVFIPRDGEGSIVASVQIPLGVRN